MSQPLTHDLEALGAWRLALLQRLQACAARLESRELIGEAGRAAVEALAHKLQAEQLVLACVAEVSRGKTELLNAIFFGDAGRRMLPASPGRTTMCPVELRHDAALPAEIALLPVDTRLDPQPLAAWRARPDAWQRLSLDASNPGGMAEALRLVTQTRRVDTGTAARLGFWHDGREQDNPPPDEDGTVEIPAWRHAVVNVAHPLLQQGLVVVDTPGLNAVGAEPELTLGLLPGAHAAVFLLAADTGVSRSDLELWTTYLDGGAMERFVVLNKTDLLADPLGDAATAAQQLEAQRAEIARLLQVAPQRVFALSARDALAARVAGDAGALARSGLPAFEAALAAQLLPGRRALLARAAAATAESLRAEATRRIALRRREAAEQLVELRGLRGRSGLKVQALLRRLDAEVGDFERCCARLGAVRAVLRRQMQQLQAQLAGDALQRRVVQMRAAIDASTLGLGAARALHELFEQLRQALAAARAQADEAAQMLGASYRRLNAEHGFAFTLADVPPLERFGDELGRIERSFGRHAVPAQAWRLAGSAFAEKFQQMLAASLRVVFETAAGEAEVWGRAAAAQLELQLHERRRAFGARRDALERVRAAAGELEQRIAEVEQHDLRLAGLQWQVDALADELRAQAAAPAQAGGDAGRAGSTAAAATSPSRPPATPPATPPAMPPAAPPAAARHAALR